MSPAFRHAVAAFDPTESAVLLWARLSGGVAEATWAVAADPTLGDPIATGTATTGPDRDWTVTVEATGLAPGTTYWYQFTAGGDRSPVGRFRTLPGAPVDRLRLGLVCCANYSVAPLGVYRALADREVDLVVHLGDYIYEDDGSHGPRPHRPAHTAVTLADYRQRLAQIREDPDLQALHLRHAMTSVWDDHDLSDNAWSGGAKAHDPETHGSWSTRVTAAVRARQEWVPARLTDASDPTRIWRSAVVGDLAELILLDTRLTGRDRQAGDDGAKALHDPTRSLLGGEQRAWMQERLADVSRPWAVVISSVVVNDLELAVPGLSWAGPLLPGGYAVIDGRVLHDDQWDGYPAERDRLVACLGERGRAGGRTVVLSGDVHSSWAFDGPCEPTSGQAVAVEMTVPAVSSAAMGRAHYPGLWRLLDRAADRMDHVRWSDVTERGYAILDLTPAAAQADWWFAHPYADDPGAEAELGATYVSARADWPPRWQPASEPSPDPVRPGLPAPLPPRPDDLAALRRRRGARIAAELSGFVVVGAAPVAAVAVLWWRRRRARRSRRGALAGALLGARRAGRRR